MARQLRIEYEGACYHVMCRGNGGEPIYKDDLDRELFLKTLWECCKQTGWVVHAYVLMGNITICCSKPRRLIWLRG